MVKLTHGPWRPCRSLSEFYLGSEKNIQDCIYLFLKFCFSLRHLISFNFFLKTLVGQKAKAEAVIESGVDLDHRAVQRLRTVSLWVISGPAPWLEVGQPNYSIIVGTNVSLSVACLCIEQRSLVSFNLYPYNGVSLFKFRLRDHCFTK